MSHSAKPVGHIAAPLIIFAFVALLLGAVSEIFGVFRGVNEGLTRWFEGRGVKVEVVMGLPDTVGILITAAAVFGIAGAILTTPGSGRRNVLGFTALMLAFFLIPAFAVWGIFWKPGGTILAVIWSWISAAIYAQGHRMPCEGGAGETASNVINLQGERDANPPPRRADGQS